jgi:hypothetical protein
MRLFRGSVIGGSLIAGLMFAALVVAPTASAACEANASCAYAPLPDGGYQKNTIRKACPSPKVLSPDGKCRTPLIPDSGSDPVESVTTETFAPPAPLTKCDTVYKPLEYGVVTSFMMPAVSDTDNNAMAYDRREVQPGEWSVALTPFGAKPSTVGLSSVCFTRPQAWLLPSENAAEAQIVNAGSWSAPAFDWDRLNFSNIMKSNWTTKRNGSDWYHAGWQFCASGARTDVYGPYAPASTLSTAVGDAGYQMPATTAAGQQFTNNDYVVRNPSNTTRYEETPWASADPSLSIKSVMVDECYVPGRVMPNNTGSVVKDFNQGRTINTETLRGKWVKYFTVGGVDSAKAGRAHIILGGHVVSPTIHGSDSLTDPASGIYNLGSLPLDTFYGASSVSASCRGIEIDNDGVGLTGEQMWAKTVWSDGNRRSYFDATDCKTGTNTPPGPPAGTLDVPGPKNDPAGTTPVPSERFDNALLGISGMCLNANVTPTIEVASSDGAVNRVQSNRVEVLANNKVHGVDFGGSSIRMWVRDADGNWGTLNTVKKPGSTVQHREQFFLGGIAPTFPGTLNHTLSPTWKGTVSGNSLVMEEVNRPEGQPYQTVPGERIAEQRISRTNNVWQPLNQWTAFSAGDAVDGLGVAFDEPSSLNNFFGLQGKYQYTAIMKVNGVGIDRTPSQPTDPYALPGVITGEVTSGPSSYAELIFTCDTQLSRLSVKSVRVGAGF